jgi:hypothetical protein
MTHLVVLIAQDGADETDHCLVVGEDADDVGATLDLLVEPLERVVRPDPPPVIESSIVAALQR